MKRELINELFEISESYSNIHSKMSDLEFEIASLSKKREILSAELEECRSLEKKLINKIETETGQKVTADFLNIILNENC
jgi:molecular chaperone GrpE (heat shock protein)